LRKNAPYPILEKDQAVSQTLNNLFLKALKAAGAGHSQTYGVRNRPVSFATVPKGYTSFQPHSDFTHGTVTYDHALSSDEVDSYELILIPSKNQIQEFASVLADDLREYKDEYLEMSREDPAAFKAAVGQRLAQASIHASRDQVASLVVAKLS
jgi:hypothetical protein